MMRMKSMRMALPCDAYLQTEKTPVPANKLGLVVACISMLLDLLPPLQRVLMQVGR